MFRAAILAKNNSDRVRDFANCCLINRRQRLTILSYWLLNGRKYAFVCGCVIVSRQVSLPCPLNLLQPCLISMCIHLQIFI